MGSVLPSVEIMNCRDNAGNLRVGQFRIHRQAEAFARRSLRNRKISGLVTESGEALLQVQSMGIMDGGAYTARIEMRF